MRYIFVPIAFVAGLYLGLWWPDVDQRVGFLLHRSIITHGLLLPLVLVLAALAWRDSRWLRWLAIGASLGVAVHLAFDLFPRGWTGFALISVPGYGWIHGALSWGWIGLNIVVCMYMAWSLVKGFAGAVLLLLGLAAAASYAANGEDAYWRPMAAIMVATALALYANRGAVDGRESSRRGRRGRRGRELH